jgi:hypothetical protein
MEVTKKTFQLSMSDPQLISNQMEIISRMIQRVPAFCLSMPHDYDLLPAVRKQILDAVL